MTLFCERARLVVLTLTSRPKDYNSQARGGPFTSSARASHCNGSSWCSRRERYFVTAKLPGRKRCNETSRKSAHSWGENGATERLLPGFVAGSYLMNLPADLNVVVSPIKRDLSQS